MNDERREEEERRDEGVLEKKKRKSRVREGKIAGKRETCVGGNQWDGDQWLAVSE